MDKFIVSARKYRPQTFDTVVGQSHITTTLKNAILHNQLAHAFLFCGPRGVGKTTCARILAKTINCENQQADGEACNTCNSCKTFNEGASLNIYELDAASNNSVDDIRSLVEQVRFAPQAGKYKVYIVDEVHMLSQSAFNAFLKTLEEPPAHVIFILATTEKYKIIPTILSRCQIFDFKRITTADTVEHLQEITRKEEITAEAAGLHVIAQKSEGCMRDALSILDKIISFSNGQLTYNNVIEHLNMLDHEYYFKLLDYLLEQNLSKAFLLYDEINSKGFDGDLVLNGFAEFLRNVLVSKDTKAAGLLDVVEDIKERYVKVAAQVSVAYLVGSLNIINEAEINYKMARNKRLHTEMTLIKLNFLQQAIELSVDNGAVIKKKRIDSGIIYKGKPIPSIQIFQNKYTSKEQEKEAQKAQLYIHEPVAKSKNITTEIESSADVIQMQPAITAEQTASITSKNTLRPINKKPASNKKTLLEALREELGSDYNVEEVKDPENLDLHKLSECWMNYAARLEAALKHSAANTFKLVTLKIESDNCFIVHAQAYMQQKFIEQEKTSVLLEIQKAFSNKTINFKIVVDETVKEELPAHVRMNSRERFERIAEQYPLIRELKNRLNLEIDY